MAAEMCDLPGEGDGETGFHHPMADGETAGIIMKRFSKIKKKVDHNYPLTLYFDFETTENPVGDLKALGLIVNYSIFDVRSKHPHHEGRAYILSDSREGLEEAQKRLPQMGWEELPEHSPK